MPRNSLVSVDVTSLPRRHWHHNPNKSRLAKMDLEPWWCTQPLGRLASPPFPIWIRWSLSCWHYTTSRRRPIPSIDDYYRLQCHRRQLTSPVGRRWHHRMNYSTPLKILTGVNQSCWGNDSLTESAAPTIADFLQHQTADSYYRQAAQSVGITDIECTVDKGGLIVRVTPIDGAVQIFVQQALWERSLYHARHPVVWDHICERQMHDSMQREFLWLYMTNDMCTTVSIRSTSTRNGTLPKLTRVLLLFLASGSLEFVAIDIPRSLLPKVSWS